MGDRCLDGSLMGMILVPSALNLIISFCQNLWMISKNSMLELDSALHHLQFMGNPKVNYSAISVCATDS